MPRNMVDIDAFQCDHFMPKGVAMDLPVNI
jgi:hypothetical protein